MRVFIWYPSFQRVGHASLQLSNGTYISWWPQDDGSVPDNDESDETGKKTRTRLGKETGKQMGKEAGVKFGSALGKMGGKAAGKKTVSETRRGYAQESLEDDKDAEGGNPDKTVDLDDLKLDEEKIEEWWIGWRMRGFYSLFETNCCWVVYTALRAGGAPKSSTETEVWMPGNLYNYLRQMTR